MVALRNLILIVETDVCWIIFSKPVSRRTIGVELINYCASDYDNFLFILIQSIQDRGAKGEAELCDGG